MPYEAKRGSVSGIKVKASEVSADEQHDTFYCVTADCKAKMIIVNQGNIEEAYFRRKPSSQAHISAKCFRCGITFDKTRYDEKKFTKTGLFDWLFSPPVDSHKGETGTKKGKKGGSTIGMRSLGNVYRLCASMNKSETYNGVLIDDIFADYDNAKRYMDNLEGHLIVEVTYYCKLYKQKALLFNYPSDFRTKHNIVRVDFEDEQTFWKYYNKLEKNKKTKHTEPIVIAGIWERVEANSEYQAQCTIVSTRQIYFPK